jgi:AraC-like DNA-binding protein
MDHRWHSSSVRAFDITFHFAFDWQREADWNFKNYRVPATTFWYILGGERILEARGLRVPIRPGQFIALPNETSVSTYHAGPHAPIQYLSMGIRALNSGVDWIVRYGIPLTMTPDDSVVQIEFLQIWRQLANVYATKEPQWQNTAEQAAFNLYWEGRVKQWLSCATRLASPFMSNPNPEVDERIREACAYIQSRYHEDVKVQEIAKHVALSEGHLRSLFRQTMCMSPNQYRLQVRMDRAKELLMDRSLSLADVADRLGYDDQSYFIRLFRHREGFTPSAYRKRGVTHEI